MHSDEWPSKLCAKLKLRSGELPEAKAAFSKSHNLIPEHLSPLRILLLINIASYSGLSAPLTTIC